MKHFEIFDTNLFSFNISQIHVSGKSFRIVGGAAADIAVCGDGATPGAANATAPPPNPSNEAITG